MAWSAKYGAPNTAMATVAITAHFVIRCGGILQSHRHASSAPRDYQNIIFSLAGATLLLIAEEHNGPGALSGVDTPGN